MRVVFIYLSKGEDELREGHIFTSSSQGLKLLSIITSNPYNSKQFVLCYDFLSRLSIINGSTPMQTLIIRSSIFNINFEDCCSPMSFTIKDFQELRDHFDPLEL